MFDDKKDQLVAIWNNVGQNILGWPGGGHSSLFLPLPSSSSVPVPAMPPDPKKDPDFQCNSGHGKDSGERMQKSSMTASLMSAFGYTNPKECQPPPPVPAANPCGPEIYKLSPFDSPSSSIQVIEWDMMDKWKFVPLSMTSSFTIRSFLYPFTVIKTCIQLQHRNSVYSSMFDAFKKIKATEGLGGLYKGFWVSSFQIVSGVCYVSTYESVRHLLREHNIQGSNVRALIAGGCASVVGQTFIVPFDVISQHLMVLGQAGSQGSARLNPLNVRYEGRSKFQVTKDITREIYSRDGLKGYYRGYFASLGCYVPNSALWWGFYHVYQEELAKLFPETTSLLVVQCMSAILGGFTTTILTNPLDVCRARLQVQRLDSFPKTFTLLCQEEGLRIFTKGLSARITQSAVFSFAIILGYETIKRLSVKEEYRDQVRW